MSNTDSPFKPTLLVVDDELSVRMTISTAFEWKYNVLLCSNSKEALATVQTHEVHVAVLDIKMAGESGLDLLATLKERHPLIEVIMLTGFGTMEYMKTAWDRRAFAFARKPFDLAELTLLLERAVRMRQATEATRAAVQKAELVDSGAYDLQVGLIHDIRNLITAPMGILSLVVADLHGRNSLDGPALDYVKKQLESVDRQLEICGTLCQRHLKFVSTARSGTATDGANVGQIISELVASLGGNPAVKNTKVKVTQTTAVIPLVDINPLDIFQVLLNLATNGAQASTRPHEVRLETRLRETPLDLGIMADSERTRVIGKKTFANNAPFAVITVSDTGDGIPAATLGQLFNGHHTTKAQGAGVGLSGTAKLIEGNRALMYVETSVGKGTAMNLYFPVNRAIFAAS